MYKLLGAAWLLLYTPTLNTTATMLSHPSSNCKRQLGILFAAAKTRMLLEACMGQMLLHLHHQITANTQATMRPGNRWLSMTACSSSTKMECDINFKRVQILPLMTAGKTACMDRANGSIYTGMYRRGSHVFLLCLLPPTT